MASRALRPYSNKHSLADPRHLLRFLKEQGGMDVAAIAKSEGVSQAAVRHSIAQVEIYRKKNTSFEMDLAVRDLVISSIPQAKETLHGLLAATELVEQKDSKTGKVKVVKVDDKTTRIEAMRLVNTFAATMQPKTPMIQQSISNTAQAAATITGAETNEEKFKRLRKLADEHNRLPPEVAGVPDHIDAGEDADDEDEENEEDEELE
jgi:hypothetical protein